MLTGFYLSSAVMAIIDPSPDLTPEQVVEIQLLGLKLSAGGDPNRVEMGRSGAFFAHLSNKAMTGPIQRFAGLFATLSYKPLLGHDDYEITVIDQNENNAQMLVQNHSE